MATLRAACSTARLIRVHSLHSARRTRTVLQHPPITLGPELTELDLNHARLTEIDPGLALCTSLEVTNPRGSPEPHSLDSFVNTMCISVSLPASLHRLGCSAFCLYSWRVTSLMHARSLARSLRPPITHQTVMQIHDQVQLPDGFPHAHLLTLTCSQSPTHSMDSIQPLNRRYASGKTSSRRLSTLTASEARCKSSTSETTRLSALRDSRRCFVWRYLT